MAGGRTCLDGGMPLDLAADTVTLTEQLVNIYSVSLDEQEIADQVEQALTGIDHLVVTRRGNTVVARTDLGRDERVVIAGHIDTVPLNDNLPARRDEKLLHGLGSCDMKGGVAVALKLAAELTEPNRDVTYIFYEAEEIEAEHNGLTKLSRERPGPDGGRLRDPDGAQQRRRRGRLPGHDAHRRTPARRAGPLGPRLDGRQRDPQGRRRCCGCSTDYQPRKPVIDGLEYHEGLNAVFIKGGVAGNVLPDECVIEVNYRFAPDRDEAAAEEFLREFFDGYDVTVTDTAPGALPGLGVPAAAAFLEAVGGEANPKFGWTDVARFSSLGVPAVNFGPGDPLLAHKQEEHVPFAHIERCEQQLRTWLGETMNEDRSRGARTSARARC